MLMIMSSLAIGLMALALFIICNSTGIPCYSIGIRIWHWHQIGMRRMHSIGLDMHVFRIRIGSRIPIQTHRCNAQRWD